MWKTFAALLLCAAAASAADLDWAGWAKNTADNGLLAPSQDLIVVVDSKPLGGAANVQARFTANGADWTAQAMAHHGTANYDTHDRWMANLGKFPEGAFVQYQMDVAGPNQSFQFQDRATVSNAAAPIRWIGNLRTEPAPGALNPGASLRVFSEMSPPGVAVAAEVGLSLDDGATWTTVPMAQAGSPSGHDLWSADLGGFPEGTALRLYVRACNANGASFWDSNTGSDYRLRVNSPIRDVTTDKGRYAPGETARIRVDLDNPGRATNGVLTIRVMRLAEE
ncbi:MAG: hypothetical protein EOM72_11435, partial [Opitutae bacterium]|nr:hypothetical protein [Opitutae bacterium]